MRKIITIPIFILLSVFVNTYLSFGQIDQLKFKSLLINNEKDTIGQISIRYNTLDGYSPTGFVSFDPKINSENIISFSLPDLGKPFQLEFSIFTNPQKLLFRRNYFVESGDNITMKIYLNGQVGDSVVFYGKGREKYNLVQKLSSEYEKFFSELQKIRAPYSNANSSSDLMLKIAELTNLIKKYEGNRIKLIQNSNVNSKMKMLIKQDVFNYHLEWIFRMNLIYNGNKAYRDLIADYYTINEKDFFYEPNITSSLCPNYLYYLSDKIRVDLLILSKAEKVDILTYYNALKNIPIETVRDRLLGSLALDWTRQADIAPYTPGLWDSLLNDAARVIKSPHIKNDVSELLKRSKTSKLVNAQFVDLDGNLFDAASLKGKVILLDVWFVGCVGCASFHERFEKEIYPSLRNNKDFLFLSINLDDNKDRWIKGIESNVYSSKDYVNVTTGKWLNHPFMKYYKVTGGPFLMLIDKQGYIYSGQSDYMVQNPDYLKKLIDEILNRQQ